MKFNKKSIFEAIDHEIDWTKNVDNQIDNNITEEQAKWFIKGLEQAKTLIDMIEKKQLI